jgi:bifunctional DNA-binding transcriptional regulator/antitoxin component of YhaV-PrlF toxin-antitoxin module
MLSCIEFNTKIEEKGLILLPEKYQDEFNPDDQIKVIIIKTQEIRDHNAFLNGYSQEDDGLYDGVSP